MDWACWLCRRPCHQCRLCAEGFCPDHRGEHPVDETCWICSCTRCASCSACRVGRPLGVEEPVDAPMPPRGFGTWDAACRYDPLESPRSNPYEGPPASVPCVSDPTVGRSRASSWSVPGPQTYTECAWGAGGSLLSDRTFVETVAAWEASPPARGPWARDWGFVERWLSRVVTPTAGRGMSLLTCGDVESNPGPDMGLVEVAHTPYAGDRGHCPRSTHRPAEGPRSTNRWQQIQWGKATVGYQAYAARVPPHHREEGNPFHPVTPPGSPTLGVRPWSKRYAEWRRALHQWDGVTPTPPTPEWITGDRSWDTGPLWSLPSPEWWPPNDSPWDVDRERTGEADLGRLPGAHWGIPPPRVSLPFPLPEQGTHHQGGPSGPIWFEPSLPVVGTASPSTGRGVALLTCGDVESNPGPVPAPVVDATVAAAAPLARAYVCPHCGDTTTSRDKLLLHMNRIHEGRAPAGSWAQDLEVWYCPKDKRLSAHGRLCSGVKCKASEPVARRAWMQRGMEGRFMDVDQHPPPEGTRRPSRVRLHPPDIRSTRWLSHHESGPCLTIAGYAACPGREPYAGWASPG
jgi:hypothetical protein